MARFHKALAIAPYPQNTLMLAGALFRSFSLYDMVERAVGHEKYTKDLVKHLSSSRRTNLTIVGMLSIAGTAIDMFSFLASSCTYLDASITSTSINSF